tara:strand:+ start:362 stop:523 length:162 start_codon:yes stop_codon:yes gene_type:complete
LLLLLIILLLAAEVVVPVVIMEAPGVAEAAAVLAVFCLVQILLLQAVRRIQLL